ncbi:hypothetical protein PG994_005114 [Apiospora phragmitis]|uniref:Uncharacterized protein n=1 Tax=Apiospora phragmitis TaxID=2905665 RepID=A0ABR1VSI7_9PEZI
MNVLRTEKREKLQKADSKPTHRSTIAHKLPDTAPPILPDMDTESSFPYDSEGSQVETYHSSDEDDMPWVDNAAKNAITDASDSNVSSPEPSVYDEKQTFDSDKRPEPVDASLEYFNFLLRPVATGKRTDQAFPWSVAAALLQQVPFPNASTHVLSLESPSLGHVDINKGCFEIIRLHCDRNQDLESELAKLLRGRRDLDAELLCRGDDITYYKEEIKSLKKNRHH